MREKSGGKIVKFITFGALFLAFIVFSAFVYANPMSGSTDCTACHGEKPNFQVNISDPISGLYRKADYSDCARCHNNPTHQGMALVSTPYGYFQSLNSPLSPSNVVHDYHRGFLAPNLNKYCYRCHGPVDCKTCHNPVPHEGHGNVTPKSVRVCDGVTYVVEAGDVNYLYPAQLTCANENCHSFYPSIITSPSCLNCHTVDKGGHGDVTPLHEYTTFDIASCGAEGCHVSNLVSEHEKRTFEGGEFTCSVCHNYKGTKLDKANIDNAIASGNLSCSACHPGAGEHLAIHETTVAVDCSTCHQPNLITEHKNRGLTCATCHESTSTIVQNAIATGNKACTACHQTFISHVPLHDTSLPQPNCLSCHQPNLVNEHEARGVNCLGCHESTDPQVRNAIDTGNKACSACHGDIGTAGHYLQHETTPPLDSQYYIDTYGNSCHQCHLGNLIDEHKRRKDASGNYLTCDTCHQSSDPRVQQAIADGKTACFACHDIHGNIMAIHESTTTASGTECGKCHASNLGTEHSKYNLGCSYCHDSSNPTVLQAIDNGDTRCEACHGPIDHEAQHNMTRVDTATCESCHLNNVFTEHVSKRSLSCSVCHQSSNPDVIYAIQQGMAGEMVYCKDCHGPTDHTAQHDMTMLDSTGCANCHVANVVTEHVTNRNLTCDTCHKSTNPNVLTAIQRGMAGEMVYCKDCHGPTDHTAQHDM
ncbi:MAG: cytochrome c3 family protein, partial [Nitrososphaerales archaeon]